MTKTEDNTVGLQTAGERRFIIIGQFVRDLSFENPHAPDSILQLGKKPNIDMDIQLRINKMNTENRVYEVIQDINVVAKADGQTLFLAELSYTAIVSLNKKLNDAEIKDTLLYDCPQHVYPFARRVIADVTRDGGFPPLMLDPINFRDIGIKSSEKINNIA